MTIPKLLQLLRDNAAAERKPLNLVRNEAADEATLYVYDVIDAWWGVSAEAVSKAIAGLDPKATLHVRVNSPGGDVFEGRAIRTALRQHKGKTVGHIDGLAASAATTVVDGCAEIEISDGAFYMIHNSWTFAMGNREEMRRTADLLEQIDGAIVADYAKRTGKDLQQLVQWMNDETWFTAAQAVEHGFASRLAPDDAPAPEDSTKRSWNLTSYDKVPKALIEAPPANEPDYAAMRAYAERRLRVLQIA